MIMSAWRRIAIEKLPELQKEISMAGGAFGVWIQLHLELENIYGRETVDDSLIARIYEYASWCLCQPHDDNLRSAVVVCFYEHLPLAHKVRQDVARWLSEEEFTTLRFAFCYHLSASEVEDFACEFRAQQQKLRDPRKQEVRARRIQELPIPRKSRI